VGSDGPIHELLRRQVDPQFRDLATLLQLPRPDVGLEGGGNLTAAGLICNIISGASVLFYEASVAAVKGRTSASNQLGSGERFRLALLCHLPWQHIGALPREDVVKLLWKYTRNPLAHSLGVTKSRHLLGFKGRGILMSKPVVGLPAQHVGDLMCGDEHPPQDSPPVVEIEGSYYVVHVPEFAWAVCRMVRHLLRDPDQLPKTTETARRIAYGLYDPDYSGENEGPEKSAPSNPGIASGGYPPPPRASR
jgi:hypothetical protein